MVILLTSCVNTGNENRTEENSMENSDTITQEITTEKESVSEENTSEESNGESESESETIIEVVFPEEKTPSITHLLNGSSSKIYYEQDMKNASLSSLKTNGEFVFTGGTVFESGAQGLSAQNGGWDSIGFANPVSTDTYTAEAEFFVRENNKGGNFNAGMVGLFCKAAANLFIDGGLWFSFRQNTVAVYVKQGFEKVLDSSLPFDASEGVRFKAEGNRENVKVFANDVHIATVKILQDGISVYDSKGSEVANADLSNLSVNGDGYFRYMTHFANTTLALMKLTGETNNEYEPDDKVYAFLSGTSYAFADKTQYLSLAKCPVYDNVIYADGEMVGKMLGFEFTKTSDTLILKRDNAELKFKAFASEVEINGETHAFPTVVDIDGTLLLPVSYIGEMMGYSHEVSDGMTIIATENNTNAEAVNMARERFDLYNDVIYNYDDVECDQTGVGRYDPVPVEERLVGIAYTTWHRAETQWGGTHTWDLPLNGPYCSDDEEVIRRHGEQLRDAGVDFVFVDWSNNTEYDPASMREYRSDFRMIEEATDKLFDIWATIEGAPKICIFVGPGHNGPGTIDSGAHQKKVDQVWNDYVTNPSRKDMYFQYDGKPLLICYGATPNQYTATPKKLWNDNRFTVRWMTGFVGQQSTLFRPRSLESLGFWSWEERGAQTYTVFNKQVEAVTVTAGTRAQGKEGDAGYIPAAGRQNGATMKKQFQRAYDLGARIVLIVSWNEWTTGEQPSVEISKDIEPSKIYGTFYLDLMREQIRKFKGQIGN